VTDTLKKIRTEIDAIDDRIVDLLAQRAGAAQAIGRAKSGAKYRPEREAEVIRRVTARNPGPLPARAVAQVYTEIMSACRALEEGITVAYLGPRGTFSEEAAARQFGGATAREPCK